ncbi:MAG: type II toxin-antitoxin system PemK/MazF family toxin [Verrucomicrobia bacterium]|nr:type II toxin-antitoxin system PemK/MazF family toxin [Verrucomicrobiota bacterium]
MGPPERGEIWLADLGMAAKTRPVLVVSVPYSDTDYALIGVIPHTTTPRGSQFEIVLRAPFLQPGAFNVQGMLAVPAAKFLRRLGGRFASNWRTSLGSSPGWCFALAVFESALTSFFSWLCRS